MTALNNNGNGHSSKLRLAAGIILTLLIAVSAAQIFCAVLGILSYHKTTEEIFASKYSIVQKNLIRDIEGSLRFGKELETFIDIKDMLQPVKREHNELENIIIYDKDHKPLYFLNKKGITASSEKEDETAGMFGDMLLSAPLMSGKGQVIGYVDFVCSKESINASVRKSAVWFAQIIAASILFSAAVMLFVLKFTLPKDFNDHYLNKKRISATLIALVVLTQLAAVYLISSKLISEYKGNARSNAAFVENSVGGVIEMLMSKGVRVNRLIGIERTLNDIIAQTPEISSITVYSKDSRVLYATAGASSAVSAEGFRPLVKDGRTEGYIHAEVSGSAVSVFAKKLVYDGLTTFVISLMFATELLVFLFAFAKKRFDAVTSAGADQENGYSGLMRTAAATYLFGSTLAVSFIPLYVGTLRQSSGFLDSFSSLLSSLPVSLELFCAMPMIMLAGVWMDRRGWHEPFIIGCLLTVFGAFLSGTAEQSSSFILARGIAGTGYGLTWTSAISFVLQNTGPSNRSSAIASLVAGIITGHISGGAVGAMIADRLGYQPVFFIAVLLLFIPVVFCLVFMKEYFIKPEPKPQIPFGANLLMMKKYLSSRNVSAVLGLSMIPYSICQMGLLLFAAPVYLHSLGVSQSNIGRVLMVYGATVVYCSPFIGRIIDKAKLNRRVMIFWGGITGGLSLFLVVFLKGAMSVAAALFIMGIASSILAASQMVYAYEQPVAKEIGSGAAVSLQRFADKLGQMLGPLILGILFSFTKVETGLGAVGLMFIGASFLFLFITASKNLRDE